VYLSASLSLSLSLSLAYAGDDRFGSVVVVGLVTLESLGDDVEAGLPGFLVPTSTELSGYNVS